MNARQHNECLECCLCVFASPYAILVHSGDCGPHFWINICLILLTGIGGIIHAFWFCFCRADDVCTGGGNQININLNNQNIHGAPAQPAVYTTGHPVQPVYVNPAQPAYAPPPPTYDAPRG